MAAQEFPQTSGEAGIEDGELSSGEGSTVGSGSTCGSSSEEGTEEPCGQLAELVPVSPELLRGTRAAVPLKLFGALLREASGTGLACGDGKDRYSKSFPTQHLSEFWSHSWHGPALAKVATLMLFYNSPAAIAASFAGASVNAFLQFWAPSSKPEMAGLLSFLPACACFFLTLFLWRSRRCVFLDSVCICQSDPTLKAQGIMSLGGFLRHSKSMLVLWDSSYCTRLWCVFELAAFYFLQMQDPSKQVYVRPTFQGAGLLLFVIFVSLTSCFYWLVAQSSGWQNENTHEMFFAAAFLIVAHPLRRFAAEVSEISEKIEGFTMDSAECFCCQHGHCHPTTNEELPCDRLLVEASVQQWFGSNKHFSHFVRTELKQRFSIQCGNPYRFSLLLILPRVWSRLGIWANLLSSGQVRTAAQVMTEDAFASLVVFPFQTECVFRLASFLSRRSASRLLDAGKSALLALFGAVFSVLLRLVTKELARPPLRWHLALPLCVTLTALTLAGYRHRILH